ncbi:MAG: NAD(+) synthetase [Methanosphaera sp. rholeuAM130]|nr:NAD+ synthase [Methanosphaera sp.]RAP53919.1 MAG: NAD(+) synthetase [Methanosphaera sp. rholeuAM130]
MIDLPDFDADNFIEEACAFIKQKVEESNSKGVVLGLSGGIDSTVVACLAVRALGSHNVKAFVLPSSTTSDEDLYDANLIKTMLDIQVEYILLDDIYEEFLSLCDMDYLPNDNIDLARMNVKPRLRMTFLYYFASIYNSLVIGTGNKTEYYVGYFTKYGDGGVDFSPIADLYKQDVRMLAKKLGVPSSIIEKAPSAGLTSNQTDESELGLSYYYVDRIVYLYVEKCFDAEKISGELELSLNDVEHIIKLIDSSQHKRLTAPILKKNDSKN